MSSVLWKNFLIPDLSLSASTLVDDIYHDSVERVKKMAMNSQDISIPDPRAFRSMSRASVFLSHICQNLKKDFSVEPLSVFSVGIYCAVENGPIDAPSSAKIIEASETDFPESYRKLRNPKMYLKQLPNLVPAQLGITLGFQGPMNVYTHSRVAGLQALDQAEQDLQTGIVDYALVCASHAFDDFMVVKRTRHQDPRILTEGAAAMILTKNHDEIDWSSKIKNDNEHYFGIADQIINLVKEIEIERK